MLNKLLKKLMGDRQSKDLKPMYPLRDNINEIYPTLEALSDDELREKISNVKSEIINVIEPLEAEYQTALVEFQTEGIEKKKEALRNRIDVLKANLKKSTQEILDYYLPEVFACVKDTCRRLVGHDFDVRGNDLTWDMVPFDVQLIGAIALHKGMITEMATGEGKTLVATLPLFLNALTGRGAHLITVNDYLALRDSEWMSPIFEFHGMEVGCITTGLDFSQRKEAYSKDVTYGMNSEFGFDYLRDNMAVSPTQLVQRDFFYAIVDEVDSILIDEARTPLIISGAVAQDKNFFLEVKPHVAKLVHLQAQMVTKTLGEARQMISEGDSESFELGKALLKVYRSAPKSKSLYKVLKDSSYKKLMLSVEGIYIRDKKMHELDAELLYTVDEKSNAVDINEKARDLLDNYEKDLFLLTSLDEEFYELEQQEDLTTEELEEKKRELTQYFMDKNEKLHNITQLLKAYTLFNKDVDYIIQDNKIVIVDEFTGRAMPGRRFSEGLHQALEAKETLKIESATQTLATITLQNYFRKFEKLAGMTGTALTEEHEFLEIYKLKCVQIPTNVQMTRIDHEDVIYMTKNEKFKAIIDEIEYWHTKGKPVLVGTVSVDVSETLSRMLQRRKINHNVLNAKYHEKEADIIKEAGRAGSVVIATNMAGRGTDIKLGEGVVTQAIESYRNITSKPTLDNPFGLPIDGLHVIGSARHDSRRIDRQLRGRAGRQGDPGTSRFYLSLEDDLMRLFGSDRIAPMMQKLGVKEDEPIMHPWMTKAVERAQQKVEEHNFETRKQLIKYDEIMNQQREVIYQYRRNVLKGFNLKTEIVEMIKDAVWRKIEELVSIEPYAENWDLEKLRTWFNFEFSINLQERDFVTERLTDETLHSICEELIINAYEKREEHLGDEKLREIERRSLLEVVDSEWRDHLHEMDHLREGIGLRAYAQKDPLIEYKKESFTLFQSLIERLQGRVTRSVFTMQLYTREEYIDMVESVKTEHKDIDTFREAGQPSPAQIQEKVKLQPMRKDVVIGRNEPCPCGSGKKYKHCCGKRNEFED